MFCLNCRHEFVSRVAMPRCSKCGTLKVIEYSEIPGYRKDKHFDEEIDKLKNEIDMLKIKLDVTDNVQRKMIRALTKRGL